MWLSEQGYDPVATDEWGYRGRRTTKPAELPGSFPGTTGGL